MMYGPGESVGPFRLVKEVDGIWECLDKMGATIYLSAGDLALNAPKSQPDPKKIGRPMREEATGKVRRDAGDWIPGQPSWRRRSVSSRWSRE